MLYVYIPYFQLNFLKIYRFCNSYKSWPFYIGQDSGKRQANSSVHNFLAFHFYILTSRKQTKTPMLYKCYHHFFQNYEERKNLVRKRKSFLGFSLVLVVVVFLFLT